MADKIFLGKTFEDRFGNAELVLTRDDLNLLNSNLKDGKVKVKVKKSQAGKWYSEIDTWQPTAGQSQAIQLHPTQLKPIKVIGDDNPDDSGLPF